MKLIKICMLLQINRNFEECIIIAIIVILLENNWFKLIISDFHHSDYIYQPVKGKTWAHKRFKKEN